MARKKSNCTTGIYQITNISNGRFYIGSSVAIENRKTAHFGMLRRKKHHNNYLQNEYNKYRTTYVL